MEQQQQLLDADQVARWLGVRKKAVWEMTKRGEIPVVRLGPRRLRYDPATIQLWIERRTTQRPQKSGKASVTMNPSPRRLQAQRETDPGLDSEVSQTRRVMRDVRKR